MRAALSIRIPDVNVRATATVIMIEIDITEWAAIRPIDTYLPRGSRDSTPWQVRRVLRTVAIMRPGLQLTNRVGVVVGDFEVVDFGGEAVQRGDRDDLQMRGIFLALPIHALVIGRSADRSAVPRWSVE